MAALLILCPWGSNLQAEVALEVVEVAPGIYFRAGAQEEATAANGGSIANLGFIVGEEGVAVIDTGGSLREGQALRAAIRRLTDRPIRYVVLTHVHPDHSLGVGAFVADAPEIVGHANLPDALMRRGETYLEQTRTRLGDFAEGTRILMPTLTLADELELDLGGRSLLLRAHPTAHTNTDLSLFDRATGTLWLSDLLFVERAPAIDGSLLGWLRVMDDLATLDPARVVPGHGPIPPDWRAAFAAQRDYLEAIAAGVREVLRRRGTIAEAVATVATEQSPHWVLFEEYHGRNVTAAFVELEWE